MARHNYSSTGSPLESVILGDDILRNIGRIFRATAELEDIATAYLRRLSNLTEGQVIILIGRAPLSKRLEIVRNLAQAHGAEEKSLFKKTLGHDAFIAAIEFRNTVAHGALLGRTDEGRLAFRSAKQIKIDTAHITMEVNTYSDEDFRDCAESIESMVAHFEVELKVKNERDARLQRSLLPHAKANR